MKTIEITASAQMAQIKTPRGSAVGRTIEAALEKIDPGGDPAETHITAMRLEGLLGLLDHPQVHEGIADTQT